MFKGTSKRSTSISVVQIHNTGDNSLVIGSIGGAKGGCSHGEDVRINAHGEETIRIGGKKSLFFLTRMDAQRYYKAKSWNEAEAAEAAQSDFYDWLTMGDGFGAMIEDHCLWSRHYSNAMKTLKAKVLAGWEGT